MKRPTVVCAPGVPLGLRAAVEVVVSRFGALVGDLDEVVVLFDRSPLIFTLPDGPPPPAYFTCLSSACELVFRPAWKNLTEIELRHQILVLLLLRLLDDVLEAGSATAARLLDHIERDPRYPVPDSGTAGVVSIYGAMVAEAMQPAIDRLATELLMMRGEIPYVPFGERRWRSSAVEATAYVEFNS